MDARMAKATFLETLRTKRAEWEALLAEVGAARMTTPGADGEWSIKDSIAHVAWYEREMVATFKSHALSGSDLWNLPVDQRNAAIFAQDHDRPLQDVLAEEQRIYKQLLEALQPLADEDFNDPQRFQDMPDDWVPWDVLAGNSYDHYDEHIPSIRAWLDQGQA